MGPHFQLLLFLDKVSIVVLIDFIAILLTIGIFLIQIVNTNMYLINFHSKNIIKMYFPKVRSLKFQTCFRHSLSVISWSVSIVGGAYECTGWRLEAKQTTNLQLCHITCSVCRIIIWTQVLSVRGGKWREIRVPLLLEMRVMIPQLWIVWPLREVFCPSGKRCGGCLTHCDPCTKCSCCYSAHL